MFYLVICGDAGGMSAALDPNYRNQRQFQEVEPGQQILQGSLVDVAGQGSDRRTIALAFNRNRHSSGPV
jgi:hypothetical protein